MGVGKKGGKKVPMNTLNAKGRGGKKGDKKYSMRLKLVTRFEIRQHRQRKDTKTKGSGTAREIEGMLAQKKGETTVGQAQKNNTDPQKRKNEKWKCQERSDQRNGRNERKRGEINSQKETAILLE